MLLHRIWMWLSMMRSVDLGGPEDAADLLCHEAGAGDAVHGLRATLGRPAALSQLPVLREVGLHPLCVPRVVQQGGAQLLLLRLDLLRGAMHGVGTE
eukprot:11003419-Lingulodinium_polyedra.AAC.1